MTIINIDSLSFSSIYNNYITYFDNLATTQKMKDFYESTMGRLFIRLLSGFGAFISYIVTVARREVFLKEAQNRASNIGIAQNLGYSVFRGTNEIVTLNITPNITGIIPKFTEIGTVGSYSLITYEDVVLNENESVDVKLYIGTLESEDLTLDTSELKIFSFISSNVSESYRLYLNGEELPTSNSISDLNEDKYVVKSNVHGAVDVCYLQAGSYVYKSGDVLNLQYIGLANTTYTKDELTLDYGTVNSIADTQAYVPAEQIDSIKINAPLFHETQMVIRGRNDYIKRFKNLGSDLADTNGRDFAPAVVDLTYVKNNYVNMSQEEKDSILSGLNNERMMGIPLPNIYEPRQFKLALTFNLKRISGDTTSVLNVQDDLESLTDEYRKTLKPSIDLELIEHDIDDFNYIKRARVSVVSNTRASSTNYALGEFIVPTTGNGKIYRVKDFVQSSSSTEPLWDYTVGNITEDNGILWKCIDRYGLSPIEWLPDRNYKYGDIVKNITDTFVSVNYAFICVGIIRYSGNSQPSFGTTIGKFTNDNEIIWVCKSIETSDPYWSANTDYRIGDSIQKGSYSYECVGFKGSSASSEPAYKSTSHYSIVSVSTGDHKFSIQGNKTNFFRTYDTIKVTDSTGNNGYYTVLSVSYDSTNTNIVVSETVSSSVVDGNLYTEDLDTVDGNLLLEYFDEDETSFTYFWNTYLDITNTVNLSS